MWMVFGTIRLDYHSAISDVCISGENYKAAGILSIHISRGPYVYDKKQHCCASLYNNDE